jgi:glycosyltransferase involved in cell wall biosynthesis
MDVAVKAYPVRQQVAQLRPLDPPHVDYIGRGWALICPRGFEVIWNGGPQPADLSVRFDVGMSDEPTDCVRSEHGHGMLTFDPGYQFQTAEGYVLCMRGPVNAPKDGASPIERQVDASNAPSGVTVEWQLTRPDHPVRFEAGDVFGVMVVQLRDETVTPTLEIVDLDEDPAVYARELLDRVGRTRVREAAQRLDDDDVADTDRIQSVVNDPSVGWATWAAELRDPPPVSCICPTYARVELLEEAVGSFLEQDYPGEKELIVLNDYGEQLLQFAHPQVRIVNLPTRLDSVGEKYNALVALCSYDLVFVWHDDDIYLPHRLSYSVAHFDARRGFFKAGQAWFLNNAALSGPEHNIFHGGSCWSRDLFVRVGGYPHIDTGYDVRFEERCDDERPGCTSGSTVAARDAYYIYRWQGTQSYHLSAWAAEFDAGELVVAYVRDRADHGEVGSGPIQLNPRTSRRYVELVHKRLGTPPPAAGVEQPEFPPRMVQIRPPRLLSGAEAAALFRETHPLHLSVILPAHNESVLLQRTVEQFEATLPELSEIIVVDNGSTDGSADFLGRGDHPLVSLISTAKALGVAGARNRGLVEARGEVVVFADAHIDVPERWWQPLVATLNRQGVGVVGPAIGVMGNPELPAACGQRIAERNLRVEWLGGDDTDPHPVPTLGGGFMVMRQQTLQIAGGFDVGMPQWGAEDLELCLRYWLLGYEAWVVPDVTVLHYFRSSNPLRIRTGVVTHNLLRVALLHFSEARLARVVSELHKTADFSQALALAVGTDVWQQRSDLARRRVHDDDWFFDRFKDLCPV